MRSDHFPNIGKVHRMSLDEGGTFEARRIDLLRMGVLHIYDAVRHDFETLCDTVQERGVILLHGTQVRREDFGV